MPPKRVPDSSDGRGTSPLTRSKCQDRRPWRDRFESPRELWYGPSPVPDDDGQEAVLVHVVGITGDWMWSRVCPSHWSVQQLQRVFQYSENQRYGLQRSTYWRLFWDWGMRGPYPRSYRPNPSGNPKYSIDNRLHRVAGVLRSPDTQEMWFTAIKVQELHLPSNGLA